MVNPIPPLVYRTSAKCRRNIHRAFRRRIAFRDDDGRGRARLLRPRHIPQCLYAHRERHGQTALFADGITPARQPVARPMRSPSGVPSTRSDRPHMIEHVVIIGGGFSGSLQAINLLRHDGPRATLIERGPSAGKGLAYGAAHPSHVLNVRAGNMSALPDDPQHFVRWLAASRRRRSRDGVHSARHLWRISERATRRRTRCRARSADDRARRRHRPAPQWPRDGDAGRRATDRSERSGAGGGQFAAAYAAGISIPRRCRAIATSAIRGIRTCRAG